MSGVDELLEELKEKRFSILEEVKSINIGNDMDVTISIGIGINGANYVQNYEYSRIAIDLALGRGGDQVVIKDKEETYETKLKKVGAMLGDNVEIGCNSVLCPGSVVGRNTIVYPLSMVRGVVEEKVIYKSKSEVAERR